MHGNDRPRTSVLLSSGNFLSYHLYKQNTLLLQIATAILNRSTTLWDKFLVKKEGATVTACHKLTEICGEQSCYGTIMSIPAPFFVPTPPCPRQKSFVLHADGIYAQHLAKVHSTCKHVFIFPGLYDMLPHSAILFGTKRCQFHSNIVFCCLTPQFLEAVFTRLAHFWT